MIKIYVTLTKNNKNRKKITKICKKLCESIKKQ